MWFHSGGARPSPRSTEGPGTRRWRPCLRSRAEGRRLGSAGGCGRSPLGAGVHAPSGGAPRGLELVSVVTVWGAGYEQHLVLGNTLECPGQTYQENAPAPKIRSAEVASPSPRVTLLICPSIHPSISSFYFSVHPCIYLPTHPSNTYRFIYLSFYILSMYPSIHPSTISLCIHPSIYHLSMYPRIHPSAISLCIHPSTISLCIHPSTISLCIHPSIYHLSMYPSIHPPSLYISIHPSTISLCIHPSTISLCIHPSIMSIHPATIYLSFGVQHNTPRQLGHPTRA